MPRAASLMLLPLLLGAAGALRYTERQEVAGDSTRHVDIGGVQIKFPASEEWPVDPSVVQAVYVACGGNACEQGKEAIRSFLAQARLDGGQKPVLHLFLDEECAVRVENLQRNEPLLAEAATVKIYIVSRLHLSTALNLYKQCASLRLSLPRLLPSLPKVLYMDTDTYVASSLRQVWEITPPLWAFGENDLTWYTDMGGARCPADWFKALSPTERQETTKCYYGLSGLNSGVMLLNQDAWRARDMDLEVNYWVETLTHHGRDPKVFRMGDQDIFNLLAEIHKKENLTQVLPCNMNSQYLNRYMCFFGPGAWSSFVSSHSKVPKNTAIAPTEYSKFGLQRNSMQPVIIHSKFNVKGNGERCWTDLHIKLRDAVDKVARGEADGAKSVCEVAQCDMS